MKKADFAAIAKLSASKFKSVDAKTALEDDGAVEPNAIQNDSIELSMQTSVEETSFSMEGSLAEDAPDREGSVEDDSFDLSQFGLDNFPETEVTFSADSASATAEAGSVSIDGLSIDYQLIDDLYNRIGDKNRALLSQILTEITPQLTEEFDRVVKVELNQMNLNADQKRVIAEIIGDRVLGLGPLEVLMRDRDVTEIMVNAPDKVFVAKKARIYKTEIKFKDNDDLSNLANRIGIWGKKQVTSAEPIIDSKLPNGSRVHIVRPPASSNGSTVITIRKSPDKVNRVNLEDLLAGQALSDQMLRFFKMVVLGKGNVLICGETDAGKTTFIRGVAGFIREDERIIVIEDTAELGLANDHVISLEAQHRGEETSVSVHDLLLGTLRMRPDRLILGEVRGVEGADMIESMQSGQRGGMTTIHAGSPDDAEDRLTIMISKALPTLSENAMRKMIHNALDIMIFIRKLPDYTRKITRVVEVLPITRDNPGGGFRDLFEFRYTDVHYDEEGYVDKIEGEHIYMGEHLSDEKLRRYFEFGAKIPEEFGKVKMVKVEVGS